jgi:hypothetical protein
MPAAAAALALRILRRVVTTISSSDFMNTRSTEFSHSKTVSARPIFDDEAGGLSEQCGSHQDDATAVEIREKIMRRLSALVEGGVIDLEALPARKLTAAN